MPGAHVTHVLARSPQAAIEPTAFGLLEAPSTRQTNDAEATNARRREDDHEEHTPTHPIAGLAPGDVPGH